MRRLVALSLACSFSLALSAPPAAAQPKIPPPTLRGVLADSIVAKARVRWSRPVGGGGGERAERIEVSIGVGQAERKNPQWSPEPVRLHYDLNQHRELERELKRARLGTPSPTGQQGGAEERTLELFGRGQEGWVVVGSWTLPAARWKKQHGALFRLLEPLFDAPAEPFVPVKGAPR